MVETCELVERQLILFGHVGFHKKTQHHDAVVGARVVTVPRTLNEIVAPRGDERGNVCLVDI